MNTLIRYHKSNGEVVQTIVVNKTSASLEAFSIAAGHYIDDENFTQREVDAINFVARYVQRCIEDGDVLKDCLTYDMTNCVVCDTGFRH